MARIFVAIAALALLTGTHAAAAQPGVPATFFGSAAIDSAPVPSGTEVRAFVDGIDCTQSSEGGRGTITQDGVSAYSVLVVHESQRAGCGTSGAAVTFTIDGRAANEAGVWQAAAQQLDLNVGAGDPLALPSVTVSPPPAGDIDSDATATAEARFTPLPATALPTDDPAIRAGTASAASRPGDDEGGSDLVLPLAIGVIVLTSLGVAAGVVVSRRRTRGASS